jgi:hypothetical protein
MRSRSSGRALTRFAIRTTVFPTGERYCNAKPAGVDGRTGGDPVTWLSLEDVNRDLTSLAARPDLVVLLTPDE